VSATRLPSLAAVQAVGGSVSGFYDKVAAEVAKM
jgi:hypothetical protein